MSKRIAILGSCVTRDAITPAFPGAVVHYRARTKSASIASTVPVEMPEVPEFHARVKFTQACRGRLRERAKSYAKALANDILR